MIPTFKERKKGMCHFVIVLVQLLGKTTERGIAGHVIVLKLSNGVGEGLFLFKYVCS